ncbi:GCN5 family acetyltransferase [Mucilaginibacter celer]|uniref:GCN5 family acetyltransferase n=1 Tax=Mucilaginibacter celer TaxID=2305508 RepID=A0A494VQU8_9SPHI|nr:GCN5 family acetyltransferase [Mucilaginibacter celer]AYL97956.1 GCN5 family acetyltransferase [Mucilaginibacter celer]
MSRYPKVKNIELVGTYPASVNSGGGYVWDAVLEYRVWLHPHDGAPDLFNGDDYCYFFDNYEDALEFSNENQGSEEPLALILQEEYLDEPEPNKYIHIKKQRITEWDVEFLNRPRRTSNTIPDFLSPDAPDNRLAILRGLV